MRNVLGVFVTVVLTVVLTVAGARLWQAREQSSNQRNTSDTNVITGTKTTTFEVGEAITGMQSLNRINVFQAYLVAVTESKECQYWGCIIESNQALISPAFVNYYVDMNEVNARAIRYDAQERRLTIKLPPVRIERPNIDTLHQRLFTDGVLGQITGSARRLEQKTRPAAVRQLKQQAASGFLITAARRQAITAVFANARKTLDAANGQNVSLTVGF